MQCIFATPQHDCIGAALPRRKKFWTIREPGTPRDVVKYQNWLVTTCTRHHWDLTQLWHANELQFAPENTPLSVYFPDQNITMTVTLKGA